MKKRFALAMLVVASAVASILFFVETSSATLPLWRGGGDLSDASTMVSQTVVGIQSKPVPSLSVGALYYDGGSWSFAGPSTVLGHGTAGQALWTNDAGVATTWVYPHGDVDASATDPGSLTVNAIQGFGVSTSVPSSGNALVYSSGLWRPNPINLAGGSTSVTGSLPIANVAPGTAGQILVSNATPATAWTSLISYETTHGRFNSGGGGSDTKIVIGPIFGSETSNAGIYALAGATAPSASNWSFLGDGVNAFFNAPSGALAFEIGASGKMTLTSTILSPIVPTIRFDNSVSAGVFGTNAAAATLSLQADAAQNVLQLAGGTQNGVTMGANVATTGGVRFPTGIQVLARNPSNTGNNSIIYDDGGGVLYYGQSGYTTINIGGASNSSLNGLVSGTIFSTLSTTQLLLGTHFSESLLLDWTTGTTPLVQASTTSTALTVGTNKSGAVLKLQGDAATTIETISASGTDHAQITAPAAPSAGNVRVFVDSADGRLKAKNPNGDVFVLTP